MIQHGKKIKILFAIGRLSVGGAEKLLVKQLPVVNKEKFNPYLLTLFSEQKDSFASEIVLDADHWKKLDFRSLFDLISWWKLFSYLWREKFDVVVTSLFSANLIVRIMAISVGVPVIISYEHNIYPNKHKWQILADKLLSYWTKKILVDSDAAKTFTAKQENIPLEKFLLLYIPPLLDMNKARNSDIVRQELGIPAGAKIILTVSRLVEEKGHRYLIEAAKKVLEEFPNAYFVIVGWGPMEEVLRSKVKGQRLEANVLLPGRMDIRDVLPLADVYVDPAIWTDLPIAIMEAMRLAKPVVASAIGEISVFVRDGKTGFLVAPGNAPVLAEKILRLLKDEELRKKFGDAAEEAVRKYSLEEYENKFEELISGLFRSNI